MNALRLAAICTVAVLTGSTWAQNAPAPTETMSDTSAAPPSTDVGGVSNAMGSGAAIPATSRQQVYQDLIHSEQSGEQARLMHDTYQGH